MSQWVQHISGYWQKWHVHDENDSQWIVTDPNSSNIFSLHLPKSEYIPCEPPEHPKQWIDVTEDCELPIVMEEMQPEANRLLRGLGIRHCGEIVKDPSCYRLRKVKAFMDANALVTQWAFVVERREP